MRSTIGQRQLHSRQRAPSGTSIMGSRPKPKGPVQLLSRKLQKMMEIERHHVISISNHDDDDLDLLRTWIEWCPKYEAVPGARGGKGLLHHVCRHCRRTCFHLLDRSDGVRQRICLGCWMKREDSRMVPEWYYHSHCSICRKQPK